MATPIGSLEAFPSARAFAVPSVIAQMRAHATAEVLAGQWQSRFTEPLAATAATAATADPVPPGGLIEIKRKHDREPP